MMGFLPPDREWAAGRVAPLPARWQRMLLDRWQETHDADRFGSNTLLRKTTDNLLTVRIPLDASEQTICEAAQALAARCAGRAEIFHDAQALRQAMERIAEGQGITPPPEKVRTGPAIARMTCPMWWRRKLRAHHGRQVEGAAIGLGYVNKAREPYCSNETLHRRMQQNARNAAAMESTIARNELGQEFTLAELAAKGPANKAIRRAELMTRINGFERIARDMGHAGLFMTITCPSRMHAFRTVAGWKVEQNPRYDGETTPRTAQQYLAKVWARIRAKLKRMGALLYGFRIAEPQHDGTPHWHFLVFHAQEHAQAIRGAVLEHALRDSQGEPGAHAHRVDFKPIDWSRGTAAGYIAKYVAKNIDGYRLEKDLHGNDALETSARVEAWASTWGIRQFQQVGGPPVGVWRELRRVEALPAGAPDHLRMAHEAVNKVAVIEGRENASVAWDRYCRAQGGVFCGRDYLIRLTMQEQPEKLGRYGDPAGPRPVGVETSHLETYTPAHMAHIGGTAVRRVFWEVESNRHEWVIVGRAGRSHGGVSIAAAQPAPWTCVNNCTEGGAHGHRVNEGAPRNVPGSMGTCGDAGTYAGGGVHGANAETAGGNGRSHGSGKNRAGACRFGHRTGIAGG